MNKCTVSIIKITATYTDWGCPVRKYTFLADSFDEAERVAKDFCQNANETYHLEYLGKIK